MQTKGFQEPHCLHAFNEDDDQPKAPPTCNPAARPPRNGSILFYFMSNCGSLSRSSLESPGGLCHGIAVALLGCVWKGLVSMNSPWLCKPVVAGMEAELHEAG